MAKRRRKRDGTWEEPKALRRLRAALTEERKLREFHRIFGRDPSSEEELDVFIEELTIQMYNGGRDNWPPDQSAEDCP